MEPSEKKKRKKLFHKNDSELSPIEEDIESGREVIVETKNGFNTVEVIVIIIISIIFGIVVGSILSYEKKGFEGKKISTELSELVQTYHHLLDNYYDSITEEDLVNAAVSGMIGSLKDPYSSYMTSEQAQTFNQKVDGSYVGIGATIGYADTGCYVADVVSKSPSDKAGLQVGDVLLKVDDTDVSKMTLDELTPFIKGKKQSKVEITVRRDELEKVIKITRATVEVASVSSKMIENKEQKIGYLAIDTFAANTYSQFQSKLKSLEKEKVTSLIIDVRDNPGGHLNQIDEILSMFFSKKTVLYQIEVKGKKEKIMSSTSEKRDYPIVILVNGNSASASEIMASSFQDNCNKCQIIGTQSYGKGTVQNVLELSTGASLKYTTQKWLTSKGKWLDGVGVTPDIIVAQPQEYYDSPKEETDLQLQKALEFLTKKES